MVATTFWKRAAILVALLSLVLIVAACAAPTTPAAAPAATTAPAPAAAAPAATSAPEPTAAPAAAKTDWPTKDITWIVPRKPGGGFDLQSRIAAPVWEKKLPNKASVIIYNQGAAGGKVGTMETIKAAPDGYTMGILDSVDLARMTLNNEMEGFDVREITWLARMSWDAGVVSVSSASGFKTVEDLKTRELRVASTAEDVFPSALMAQKLGLKTRSVLFESAPEGFLALMRGDADITLQSWTTSKKQANDSEGKVVPLFVLADERLPGWPELPSSKELGLDLKEVYYVAGAVRVLGAPKGVPEEVATSMRDTIWAALQDAEFKANMEKAGYDPSSSGPASAAEESVELILKVLQENKELLDSLQK